MRGEPNTLRLLLPFYLGVLTMSAAVVTAHGFAIDTPEFVVRAHILVLIGLTTSLVGALTGRNPSIIGTLIASFVFPLLILANTGASITRVFYPDETLGDHSLLLPTLAVWLVVVVSFAQVNRSNSIFIFVCGLVVFALTGTVNLNESLLITFFVFLLATYFVWSYNSALNLLEQAYEAGQPLAAQPARWANTQLGVAVGLVALVFVGAVATGYPAFAATRNFFVGPFPSRSPMAAPLPALRNYAGFMDEFVIAGGAINLDQSPALTVKSTAPALWRGLVYNEYTRRGWRRTIPGPQFQLPEEAPGTRRFVVWESNWNLPRAPYQKRIKQTVKMHTGTGGVLIAAATPVALRGVRQALRPALDNYGCLHTPAYLIADREYEVESVAAAPSAEAMRKSPDNYPPLIQRYYLMVPAGTRAELQDLADRITAGCNNAYDKARAIENYLYTSCRYTLDVPPIPPQQDAVTYFLLTTRRGACDLYASAFVILMRLAGVPARVVTGYSTGEQDPTTGVYRVMNADAHAWAEVYFPGIGWVEFDPPVQKESDRLSWLSKLFTPGWTGPALRAIGRRAGAVLIALVLINALIVAVSGASPVRFGMRWLRRRRTRTNLRQRTALAYLAVCQRLARYVGPRAPGQTPTDYARQAAACELLPLEIRHHILPEFTREFLRLRYSPVPPTIEDAAAFARRARELAKGIGRVKRIRQS